MALHGNLKDYPITQLLNLVNLSHKTGTLVVQGSAGTAWLAFEKGKLAFARVGKDDGNLSKILLQNKKINANIFEYLRKFGDEANDKEVGLYLINGGYVTRDEITALLHRHYFQSVRNLFSWKEGSFWFNQEETTPEDKIAVHANLEDLIVEGSRQTTQGKALMEEVPDLDVYLKFPDRPRADIKSINLNKDEWQVISFINPRNSIRQIAVAAGLNDLEIRKIVYSLMQASLVEVVRTAPQPKPGIQTRKLTKPEIEEQKSLVTRIIGRFRSDKA
ncbi:MAG: DUF4388 domain-containing protein [Anaerolineaceae bacterium]